MIRKRFDTNGIGSQSKTTGQPATRRKILDSLDFQSNKLHENNCHGLSNKNFQINFLEIQFPNMSLGLNWRKTASSKIPTAQLTFLAAFSDALFAYGSIGSVFCTTRAFFALTNIHPVNCIQFFLNETSIFSGYIVQLTSVRNLSILVIPGIYLA